jgi:AraC-like DNA-binding protein
MLDPRTVANSYVRTLLAAVESEGIRSEQVLQGLPITHDMLTTANGRIGVALVHQIWQRALTLTANPLLGLKVALQIKPSTFRVLGLAAMSCESLAQGLSLMLRYHRLVSEAGALTAETNVAGDVAIIYTEQLLRLQLLPQQVEAIVGGILCQARWLSGHALVPLMVTFKHARQGDLKDYQQFFGVDVQFAAPRNMLHLAAIDLQQRLPQADADLCRVHCELADRQLASLPSVGFITSFAMQWLATQATGSARVDDLAQTLGLSVRSLQRQLKEEGKSWTEVIDDARQNAFITLQTQGLSLEAAAQQMGYHDASSLSRAAKRWFGKTPGQWRMDTKADG